MEYVNLKHLGFGEINLNDVFFDSLKKDYGDFETWFQGKANDHEDAYVQLDENGDLQGFLYLKMEENNIVNDVTPSIIADGIVKAGTFKINAHGTRMGEQFLKILFDYAVDNDAEVCYMTIFEKHQGLIGLIKNYGFIEWGTKGKGEKQEKVFVKRMHSLSNDILKDYPFVKSYGTRKFLLSIYPKYHSAMFPESILTNESRNIIKDISYTNSIQKKYVCSMPGVEELQKGDLIVIYRTAEFGKAAEYSAVVSTVCTVTDVRMQSSFSSFDDFYEFSSKFTVFDRNDLYYWYSRGKAKVISMVYNFPLKKRIVRHELIERIGLDRDNYWGFFELSDEQFLSIVKYGQAVEYLR